MTPMMPTISPPEFVARWRDAGFGERQGAQSFFNDLCGLVGHATPPAYGDPEAFTFEKAVPGGFADAYYEEHFGWEFKGQDAQLDGAFDQLLRYQVHLKTPPLLIVSSFETVRIQTNFPGMETARYDVGIGEFEEPARLELLRDVFFAPHRFRERLRSVDAVTRETAAVFQSIVVDMEQRNEDPERLARYLNQLVFCLYAEDAGLLPEGLFTRIVAQHYRNPATFDRAIRSLFAQMATGGFSGADEIAHFNGDLFNVVDTVELSTTALQRLGEACERNWRDIEPSIFGTLFERALDASKRAQTGAHYTGADDIELVVEPVVMTPLRREWETARGEIEGLREGVGPSESGFSGFTDFQDYGPQSRQSRNPVNPDSDDSPARTRLESFRQRLASVTVLDPACGSGNFLYIALRSLLDLEKEVIDFAAAQGWLGLTPRVQPDQMLGLEINHYAAELARTALWIGYIQWHQANGFAYTQRPILTPLDTIRQTDAILDLTDPDSPAEPEWPAAEFIVGNPPFLGGGLLRQNFTDEYVEPLFRLYGDRIPNFSDLCCYWFEKARAMLASQQASRCGLLATQGIRGRANRSVLERIKETGDIFAAYSDRPWILEGAAVHVSIVCFDDGSQAERTLDGNSVPAINANLMQGADLTKAQTLGENAGICFIGDTKKGKFEIPAETASLMLGDMGNPNGRSNSEVVRPWANGLDVTRRSRDMWIVDFDMNMSEYEAAQYEMPFEHIKNEVKPARDKVRNSLERQRWWVHGRPAPELRQAIAGLGRYIATARVAKFRLFVFLDENVLPDGNLVVFARNDFYTLGVLHSRIHEVWALQMGTQLEDRPRYSHTATFGTFPFPRPTEAQRRGHRRGGGGVEPAAGGLAESRGRQRGGVAAADADQPLQRPSYLAGQRAPDAGRGGVRRLRLAGGPGGGGDTGAAAGAEPGAGGGGVTSHARLPIVLGRAILKLTDT